MLEMKSNFYPASEPKNGYIGKADIIIANAVRINNISVFTKDDGYSIDFSNYGENGSYVVPKSKDAYAAMLSVVSKAVDNEGHFAFEKGTYGPKFEVRGTKVDEKYADGRYSLDVGDLCTLNGITTRYVEFEKDGKQRAFVSVDLPAVRGADGKVRMYTNSEGKDVASLEYQGLVSNWTDKEGNEQSLDYSVRINDAVKKARKELYPELYADRKSSLNEAIGDAEGKKKPSEKGADSKEKTQDEPAR